jgi:hypothetical protein
MMIAGIWKLPFTRFKSVNQKRILPMPLVPLWLHIDPTIKVKIEELIKVSARYNRSISEFIRIAIIHELDRNDIHIAYKTPQRGGLRSNSKTMHLQRKRKITK